MKKISLLLTLFLCVGFVFAQEEESAQAAQDRESMAVDATATQWSFQFAYQAMPDYYGGTISDGSARPLGLDDYVQLRIVAPIPLKKFTILPRLTLRHYENANTGKNGMGNTELFALIVPKAWDWGSGRVGLGPLVTLPGNEHVAKDEWGYGLAGAYVNNKGKFFYGLLLTQSFRAIDPNTLPAGTSDTNPLGIAPFVNYRIDKGWYVQTADIVALYSWDKNQVYVPMGARIGKVWVGEKSSWNLYGEYRTSMVYKGWDGSAVKNSYRINLSYTMPIGL